MDSREDEGIHLEGILYFAREADERREILARQEAGEGQETRIISLL